MTAALVIARNPESAKALWLANGVEDPVVSDDPTVLTDAIADSRPCISTTPDIVAEIHHLDAVVEATGDVEYGARTAVAAMVGGHHMVSLNYETDATVGPLLNHWATQRGVVYTGSDGDQPGVMKRMVEYVEGIGLETVAAVNCKGFLDIHATPETIRPWAEKQGTSLHMTTAFTDGTKMNVENVSVANATGLIPARRGMVGVETTLADAVNDFERTLDRTGVVDYTLGGDFKGGIFVIGTGAHPELAAPYLEYLKMGPGPWYLFYRPWHLVQMETAVSIGDCVLDARPTIAPVGAPVAEVITVAKRDLSSGTRLDGIGGYDSYGQIDTVAGAEGILPMGLVDKGQLTRDVRVDEPVTFDAFEFDDNPLVTLWQAQHSLFAGERTLSIEDALALWGGS